MAKARAKKLKSFQEEKNTLKLHKKKHLDVVFLITQG